MQQEFYIGQKVKTSEVGIKMGCSKMIGTVTAEGKWCGDLAYYVAYDDSSYDGLFMPEEIEPIEDSSVSEIVFDNIVKSL